jgi:hypothetical protein
MGKKIVTHHLATGGFIIRFDLAGGWEDNALVTRFP